MWRASSTRSPESRGGAAGSIPGGGRGGGGSALDPGVVPRMLGRRQRDRPLDRLSPRERDVLASMAEGKSNQGIAEALFVSQAAVEKHVTSIFHKLELDPAQTAHRRVLAVLAYLRDDPSS